VIVLEAYLDESGLDGRWPVVCVGGYFAEHAAWVAFQESWKAVLAAAGVECFHATKHPALWWPLLEHIHAYGLRGMLVTVPASTYREAMAHGAKSAIGNAYAACASTCALKIAELARTRDLGPVAFVLEDGQPNVAFVRGAIERMIGDEQFNVAAVAVARKKDFIPLQTADLLAHCAGTNQEEWLAAMTGDGPGKVFHGHMDEHMLIEASKELEELARHHRHRKQQAKLAARTAARTGPPLPDGRVRD